MYHNTNFANKFLLTAIEQHNDKISYQRILEIMEMPTCQIAFSKRSGNNYGEFRFIDLWIDDEKLSFYGHGVHELREYEYGTTFVINEHDDFHKPPSKWLNKQKTIAELQNEHCHYPTDRTLKQSRESILFNMVADMGDEDSAYVELEDNHVY